MEILGYINKDMRKVYSIEDLYMNLIAIVVRSREESLYINDIVEKYYEGSSIEVVILGVNIFERHKGDHSEENPLCISISYDDRYDNVDFKDNKVIIGYCHKDIYIEEGYLIVEIEDIIV